MYFVMVSVVKSIIQRRKIFWVYLQAIPVGATCYIRELVRYFSTKCEKMWNFWVGVVTIGKSDIKAGGSNLSLKSPLRFEPNTSLRNVVLTITFRGPPDSWPNLYWAQISTEIWGISCYPCFRCRAFWWWQRPLKKFTFFHILYWNTGLIP